MLEANIKQTDNDLKAQNPTSVIISWDRENFFPANAKHLHLCGFWPPWPHFRRKSDEEAGSSRDFHAISRLKGGSLIIHSLRFPNAKKKLLLSHAIFKGQQFDHMQSLPVLTYIALSNFGLKLFLKEDTFFRFLLKNSILLHSGLNPAWLFWLSTRISVVWRWNQLKTF